MPEISERDWTELKDQVASLSSALATARRRIDDLEDGMADHLGLDWGESLVDVNSPHPNISANTIESGGGRARQDGIGLQMVSPNDNDQGIWFVARLASDPTNDLSEYVLISATVDSTTSNLELTSVLSGSPGPSFKIQNGSGEFWAGVFGAPFLAPGLSADPTTLTDGLIWYNTTSTQLKARVNGATVVLA